MSNTKTVEQQNEIIKNNIHLGRTSVQRALRRAGFEVSLSALKMRCDTLRNAGQLTGTATKRPWSAEEDQILNQCSNPRDALANLIQAGFERTFKAVAQRMRDKEKA